MKKLALLTIGLLFSASTFAAESDFSLTSRADMNLKNIHQLRKCLKEGWKAATPTDAQKTESKTLVEAARKTIKDNKATLKKDKEDVMTAWAASPIVSADVEAAEARLRTDMIAVHSAVRDDIIGVLNLLSADQKKAFNTSFKSCHSSAVNASNEDELSSDDVSFVDEESTPSNTGGATNSGGGANNTGGATNTGGIPSNSGGSTNAGVPSPH